MRTMFLLATAFYAALSGSANAKEQRRDVYFDQCRTAHMLCRWDWGKGNCTVVSQNSWQAVLDTGVFHVEGGGDGGGGPGPACMVLGPRYSGKRASPTICTVHFIVVEKGKILRSGHEGNPCGGGN